MDGWITGAHQSCTTTPPGAGLVSDGVCRLCSVPRVTPGRVTAVPHWWTCSDHRAGAKGFPGFLLELNHDLDHVRKAEPGWFRVRSTSEQHCTGTGGSSNPFPDATRTPGLGPAFVPSHEMKDGENVPGRRRWRRGGNTAPLKETCMSNQAGFGNPTEFRCQGLFQNLYQKQISTNRKALFKPRLCVLCVFRWCL